MHTLRTREASSWRVLSSEDVTRWPPSLLVITHCFCTSSACSSGLSRWGLHTFKIACFKPGTIRGAGLKAAILDYNIITEYFINMNIVRFLNLRQYKHEIRPHPTSRRMLGARTLTLAVNRPES